MAKILAELQVPNPFNLDHHGPRMLSRILLPDAIDLTKLNSLDLTGIDTIIALAIELSEDALERIVRVFGSPFLGDPGLKTMPVDTSACRDLVAASDVVEAAINLMTELEVGWEPDETLGK